MVRIYFVVKEPSERTINHFVSSLGNALQKQGCEVVYGLGRLWTDEALSCDIIHFQWPEYVFGSQKKQLSDEDVERFRSKLGLLKEKGIKIFVQIHNLKPHKNQDKNVLRLYDLLYQHADVMVHMGTYSHDLLQSQYPNARHAVIPHHIYDNMLSFSVSRQEARQRLQLPDDNKVVLCFGKFRNDKEREFVLNLKKRIETLFSAAVADSSLFTLHSSLFLTPGFYRETLHTWNPKKLVRRLYHTLRYRLKRIKFSNEPIPDDLMQCYFCAADVVLIQRLDILNSGNLPMAFAAGKVVVGPDMGHVGQILRETGNYTFDPQHMESAVDALQKALASHSIGEKNKAYAKEHWSSGVIAAKLFNCYKQAIQINDKGLNTL